MRRQQDVPFQLAGVKFEIRRTLAEDIIMFLSLPLQGATSDNRRPLFNGG